MKSAQAAVRDVVAAAQIAVFYPSAVKLLSLQQWNVQRRRSADWGGGQVVLWQQNARVIVKTATFYGDASIRPTRTTASTSPAAQSSSVRCAEDHVARHRATELFTVYDGDLGCVLSLGYEILSQLLGATFPRYLTCQHYTPLMSPISTSWLIASSNP